MPRAIGRPLDGSEKSTSLLFASISPRLKVYDENRSYRCNQHYLTSCVTGPKRENDTALDYLNGNNYRAGSATSGISPVVQRQAPTRTIRGTVLIEAAPLHLPLGNQTLILTRGRIEVTRAMSDFKGEFTLTGDIQNGTYTISLISDQYTLSHQLVVSDYKTEGLQLFATRKAKRSASAP